MVFLLVREITIERAFLLPVKGTSVIESPERGREQIYRDPIQIPLSSNRAERGRKVNVLALSLNLQIETQITSSKRFRVIIHPLKTTGIETITYVKQKYKNQKYQQLTNHIHIKKKQFQLTLTIYVNTPKTYLINQDYLYTIYFDQTNLIHPLDIEAAFLSRMETGRKLPGDVQKRQTCPVPLSSRGVHNLSSSIIYEGPSSDLSPSRP